MTGKHGLHNHRMVGWHPRSPLLLAFIEQEIARRRAGGSRAPQGDLLEEAVDHYRVACEQAGDSPIPWRPPKGGKLRARLTTYAGRMGLPVNYIITEAVRCLLDAEAPVACDQAGNEGEDVA